MLPPRCGHSPYGATERAPRTCLDSTGKPGSDNPIVLWDPNPLRFGQVASALKGLREIDSVDHLKSLTICGKCRGTRLGQIRRDPHCPKRVPSLILLPFEGPNPADTVVEGEESPTTLLLRFIKTFARRVPIVVHADITRLPISLFSAPLASGARQVLNSASPTFLEELRTCVARLLEEIRTQEREQEQVEKLFAQWGLVACSQGMHEVFRRAIKASHFSDLPVLILGETGTGKQRLAEAIRAMDPQRWDKPFLTVNCGALSKSLAESELFGHSRGAFSGAAGERKGLFRAVNGGTLLLDEIGELDLELQPKLLRVLQDRQFLPVGEDYEQAVDVRIIAATNSSIEQMVAEGRFREDLYQRLNVFRIHIPPLRERPEDIEAQARHFLQRHQKTEVENVGDLSDQTLALLRALHWEGNSRQLENLVREALVHKQGGKDLEAQDLPHWVFEQLAQTREPAAAEPLAPLNSLVEEACDQGLSFDAAIAHYERCLLERVLQLTGGNRTRAAARLGLTPRTIFAKIRKHHLS